MAMELDKDRLLHSIAQFPPPSGIIFSYGTAGFRTDASLLDSTVFRTGVLAALRSLCTRSTTGIMITASHNQVSDNGVKVADPGGDMLAQDWEPFANALANAQSPAAFLQLVEDFTRGRNAISNSHHGRVIVARDTRPSGERLLEAAKQGVEAVSGVTAMVAGILTTPQLHWMVRATNRGLEACESDYFIQLSNGFRHLCEMKPPCQGFGNSCTSSKGLIVDGANGVGASKLLQLQNLTPDLCLDIRNSGQEGEGVLNEHVGADFVQKEKAFPRGFGNLSELGRRCASLDGDADRIVFFYSKQSEGGAVERLHLLDGDKILTLFAIFIRQQLQDLCQYDESKESSAISVEPTKVGAYGPVKLGVVQTAYANGASTKFLRDELGIEVVLASTGVKHLHHKAAGYDIGIYFEANGHGTVIFDEKFLLWLRKEYPSDMDQKKSEKNVVPWNAAQRLIAVSEVVNQAIGDALSGLLLVEAVLHYLDWSIQDWDAMYSDLPSRQLKVTVKNRASIKTTNAETVVTSPPELQDAINMEVVRVNAGRAFVRPSGTEDIVRVYAEAATQDDADILAYAVATHVYHLADGIGDLPG